MTTPTQKQSEMPDAIYLEESDGEFHIHKVDSEIAQNPACQQYITKYVRAQPSETPVAEKVREALEFYAKDPIFISADGSIYERNTFACGDLRKCKVGRRAREALALLDQQSAPETVHWFNGKLYSRRQLEAENQRMRDDFAALLSFVQGMKVEVPYVPHIKEDYREEKWRDVFVTKAVNTTCDTIIAEIKKKMGAK